MKKEIRELTIAQIKFKILEWRDLYGMDISDRSAIMESKTKEDLTEVLNNHNRQMENLLNDAQAHLKEFTKEIGLN